MTAAAFPETFLFIDGEWIPASARDTIEVENPATREVIGTVPVATEADVDRAMTAAARAFPAWRDLSPHRRTATTKNHLSRRADHESSHR